MKKCRRGEEEETWVSSCSYSSLHHCIMAVLTGSLRFGIQVEQGMIKTWVEWKSEIFGGKGTELLLSWQRSRCKSYGALRFSTLSLSLTCFLPHANLNDSLVDFLFPIFLSWREFLWWNFSFSVCMTIPWVKNPLSFDLLLKSFTWWFNFFLRG